MAIRSTPTNPPPNKSPVTKIKNPIKNNNSKWFWALLAIFIVGLASSAYYSVTKEYVPSHLRVVHKNGTDLFVLLTVENEIQIPLQNYLNHKISPVVAEIYYKSIPIFIKDVKLSSNASSNSTAIISIKTSDLVRNTTTAGVYNVPIELGHSLIVKNYSEPYSVDIYYRKGNDSGPILTERIPFTWYVATLDFGKPSYFWIVFSGVLLSRVFSFSRDSANRVTGSLNFSKLELLWVPFSAFITLLIFSSFKEQFHPSVDVITNLALAFGIGFGFDKIFEVWAKAPERVEPNTNSGSQ